MNYMRAIFIVAGWMATACASAYNLTEFDPRLANSNNSDRVVVTHIWGLSCASCVADLPKWSRLAAAHPEIQFKFIESEPATPEDVLSRLKSVSLARYSNYYVTHNLTERDQFTVDPAWQGETPFTLIQYKDKTSYFFGPLSKDSISKILSFRLEH